MFPSRSPFYVKRGKASGKQKTRNVFNVFVPTRDKSAAKNNMSEYGRRVTAVTDESVYCHHFCHRATHYHAGGYHQKRQMNSKNRKQKSVERESRSNPQGTDILRYTPKDLFALRTHLLYSSENLLFCTKDYTLPPTCNRTHNYVGVSNSVRYI